MANNSKMNPYFRHCESGGGHNDLWWRIQTIPWTHRSNSIDSWSSDRDGRRSRTKGWWASVFFQQVNYFLPLKLIWVKFWRKRLSEIQWLKNNSTFFTFTFCRLDNLADPGQFMRLAHMFPAVAADSTVYVTFRLLIKIRWDCHFC